LLGLYRALKDTATQGSADAAELARFRAAMDDDFNTPDALAVLQSVARELNQAKAAVNASKTASGAATMRAMGAMLGILQQDPDSYLKRSAGLKGLSDAEVEALLAARNAARAAKDYAESDRIRAQLNAAGILLDDRAGGSTQWRRA
jgi:cysteinyl-tRNA synthetase